MAKKVGAGELENQRVSLNQKKSHSMYYYVLN